VLGGIPLRRTNDTILDIPDKVRDFAMDNDKHRRRDPLKRAHHEVLLSWSGATLPFSELADWKFLPACANTNAPHTTGLSPELKPLWPGLGLAPPPASDWRPLSHGHLSPEMRIGDESRVRSSARFPAKLLQILK
jgi:hypothetical protein